ncbi:MAG: hypothetical protein AAGI66_07230 [Cyanobacteria bacterium P01_H01_bin.74]
MDAFQLIQNFFTRMQCNFCSQPFRPDDIELIRQEDAMFIVNVHCGKCNKQNGVAMVGLETAEDRKAFNLHKGFTDPELTEDEMVRLSEYDPINEDDVLDAHNFFQELDEHWQTFIPEEMRRQKITLETESQDVETADLPQLDDQQPQ